MAENVLTANDIALFMFIHVNGIPKSSTDLVGVPHSTDRLVARGLIEVDRNSSGDIYNTTEKGAVHIKTLTETEIPVQRWVKKPEPHF